LANKTACIANPDIVFEQLRNCPELQLLTEKVTRHYGLNVCAVTMLYEPTNSNVFVAKSGLDIESLPQEVSFASLCMGRDLPIILNDLRNDPGHKSNPLVKGDFKAGFYCGAPIRYAREVTGLSRIGAICVIDGNSRKKFSLGDADYLVSIADQVTEILRSIKAEVEYR